MQNSPVVWWELASHDADRSAEFFRQVFDWDVSLDERLGFYVTRTDREAAAHFGGGGIFTLRKARLPFLAIYIAVDDIHARRERIVAHGGFIVEEPFDTGNGTMICLFNEPSGVTFAMIQE
jgi:predicted enzyme related to lactoylglutathione lyase